MKFNSVSKNTRAYLNSDNMYLKEDSCEQETSEEQTTVKSRDAEASVCNGTGGDEGGDGESLDLWMLKLPNSRRKTLALFYLFTVPVFYSRQPAFRVVFHNS